GRRQFRCIREPETAQGTFDVIRAHRPHQACVAAGLALSILPSHNTMCKTVRGGAYRCPPIWRLMISSSMMRALVCGHKTKKEAVTAALHEYIKRRKQRQILDMVDQIAYDPAFAYKAARRRKRR